ncbi:hypothetical protein [Nocardia mangyaensis]|uniref:hypothetical protein n=1 Tax=Nocardia mangyaensis TaxID=2213200 RepID=UPI002677279F|nr:hypothetical protein [Nocardia mangyaensis]MDO3646519.1 hypothetical protein [Nocardia mangyaensis]
MARYEEWDDDPEDEADDRRWNGQRWPHATAAEAEARTGAQPRVNPYAMVALAAALVLLFPIAIVFGLLSFGHPRGRGIAVFALLLGITEVAALAVVGLAMFGGLDVELPNLARTTTTTQVSAQGTPSATVVPAVSPADDGAAEPSVGVVEKGTACPAERVGLIGVAADGATLLCLRGADGYTWSGPYRVAGSYYTEGTSCDLSVDKSGRTSDHRALVCEGRGGVGAWVPWTE